MNQNRQLLFEDRAKLIARLGFGGLMIPHGISKLQKAMAGGEIHFANPIGLGEEFTLYLSIFSELICALLIVAGIFTRWASLAPMITMLVAAFIVHSDDPWSKKEFALLFFVGYMVIFLIGPGKFSLDALLNKRRM